MLGNLVTGLGAYGSARGVQRKERTRRGAWGLPITALPPRAATNSNAPTIASVTGTAYLGSMTITGSNFGASQTGLAAVTIGGVAQTVTSWSAGSLTIASVARGTLKYGVAVSVSVKNPTGGNATYSITAGLQPQTGYAFTNLTSVTTSSYRIVTSPDIVAGDQIAYGAVTPSGTVTVLADGSFTASTAARSFTAEANDGTSWGTSATQTILNPFSANASSNTAATGILSTAIQLAAAATSLSTATGALSTTIALGASLASVNAATGALTTAITLLGSAVENTTASGTLGGGVQFTAAATSSSSASGSLTTVIKLLGAAVSVVQAAGNLATQIVLAANAAGSSSGSGNLTVLGQVLAGGAASSSSASGALTTAIGLAGSALSVISAAGALTAQIQLVGQINDVSTATGNLIIPGGQSFVGTAATLSSAAASLTTMVKLTGTAWVNTSAVASLTTGFALQGAAYDVSNLTADLNAPGSPVNLYQVDQWYDIVYDHCRHTSVFPPVSAGDEVVLSWDFSNRLTPGERLQGRIVVSIVCSAGADPTPSAVQEAAAAYDFSQHIVSLPVAPLLSGNEYYISVTAPTTNPYKTLTMYGLLPVQG